VPETELARLDRLEHEITELRCLVEKLKVLAGLHPKGRQLLKMMGLS
jgi:hypothetical protein